MDYLSVDEARDLSGLKLVLTGGVPGPRRRRQKHSLIIRCRSIQCWWLRAVNDALVAWTSHRNAPVAV